MREELNEKFNPKGKEYYYNFCNEEFCYKTKYGVCSLELTEEEVKNSKRDKYGGFTKDCDVEYCRKIYNSIKEEGQKYPIDIGISTCGHYTIGDGQHRICIASKKNLLLKAIIAHDEEECFMCREEKRIKDAILRKKELDEYCNKNRCFIEKIVVKIKGWIIKEEEQEFSYYDPKEKQKRLEDRKEKNYRAF